MIQKCQLLKQSLKISLFLITTKPGKQNEQIRRERDDECLIAFGWWFIGPHFCFALTSVYSLRLLPLKNHFQIP
jgi:hypothetical protein